jgi:uncharacterized protein YjbI with pentapeptide repeats
MHPGLWAVAAAVAVVLVVWALPSLLTRHPQVTGEARHAAVAAVRTALVTLLLAGFTAGSLYYTARTFRLSKLGHLTQRFSGASTQLGSEKPTVRIAGVQALAQLADEWVEQRQSCINVICAFLRAVDDDRKPVASRYERRAGTDLLRTRLTPATGVSWAGCDLDLSGIVLEDTDLSGITVDSGRVSFRGARFIGDVDLSGVTFTGSADVTFERATFEGGCHVTLESSRFAAFRVSFDAMSVRGGELLFRRATFGTGCRVTFRRAELGFGGTVDFEGATLGGWTGGDTGGGVSFAGARFGGEGAVDDTVRFDGATFAGIVSFAEAEFGRAVSFEGVQLEGATLDFDGARLERGGYLRFAGAHAHGSQLDLTGAQTRGGRIDMSRLADGPPDVVGESGRLVDLGPPTTAQTLDAP